MLEKPLKNKTGYQLPSTQREAIKRITGKYGITRVRLFGSLARGEGNQKSDIDLLVELPPKTSLFTFVAIKLDLEDFLGRPVDLVTEKAISPYIREQVLREAIPL